MTDGCPCCGGAVGGTTLFGRRPVFVVADRPGRACCSRACAAAHAKSLGAFDSPLVEGAVVPPAIGTGADRVVPTAVQPARLTGTAG